MKICNKRLASLVPGLQSFVQAVSITGLEMNRYKTFTINVRNRGLTIVEKPVKTQTSIRPASHLVRGPNS